MMTRRRYLYIFSSKLKSVLLICCESLPESALSLTESALLSDVRRFIYFSDIVKFSGIVHLQFYYE